MPLEVEFEKPARFRLRASGEVTFAEIELAKCQLLEHEAMHPGTDMLVDAREVSAVPSTGELRVAADFVPVLMKSGLGAMAFVSDNPLVYGVARMFSVFAEAVGGTARAFTCADEAQRWLSDRRAANAAET